MTSASSCSSTALRSRSSKRSLSASSSTANSKRSKMSPSSSAILSSLTTCARSCSSNSSFVLRTVLLLAAHGVYDNSDQATALQTRQPPSQKKKLAPLAPLRRDWHAIELEYKAACESFLAVNSDVEMIPTQTAVGILGKRKTLAPVRTVAAAMAKKPRVRLTAEQKELGFFWHLDGHAIHKCAAVAVSADARALRKASSRARAKQLELRARRTEAKIKVAEERIGVLFKGLAPRSLITLKFPKDPERKDHLSRLLKMIRAATISIGIEMYSFTHCEITAALIKKKQEGKLIQGCADDQQKDTPRSHLRELMAAGIKVCVKKSPLKAREDEPASWMLHDKNLIFDDHKIWSGSINLSKKGFKSGGIVHIFEAPGSNVIKSNFREQVASFIELKVEDVTNYQCESCAKALKKYKALTSSN